MLRLRRRPVQLQTRAFRIASGVIDTRTFANMQDDEGYAIHPRIRVLFDISSTYVNLFMA